MISIQEFIGSSVIGLGVGIIFAYLIYKQGQSLQEFETKHRQQQKLISTLSELKAPISDFVDKKYYLDAACLVKSWLIEAETQKNEDLTRIYRRLLEDTLNKYDQAKEMEQKRKCA